MSQLDSEQVSSYLVYIPGAESQERVVLVLDPFAKGIIDTIVGSTHAITIHRLMYGPCINLLKCSAFFIAISRTTLSPGVFFVSKWMRYRIKWIRDLTKPNALGNLQL